MQICLCVRMRACVIVIRWNGPGVDRMREWEVWMYIVSPLNGACAWKRLFVLSKRTCSLLSCSLLTKTVALKLNRIFLCFFFFALQLWRQFMREIAHLRVYILYTITLPNAKWCKFQWIEKSKKLRIVRQNGFANRSYSYIDFNWLMNIRTFGHGCFRSLAGIQPPVQLLLLMIAHKYCLSHG